MRELRNIAHNGLGSIDCELNHPEFGWIPCTLSPDDAATAPLYAAVIAGEYGPVGVASVVEQQAQVQWEHTRQYLLEQVSRFVSNPLVWEDLTATEQDDLRQYRKALLALDPATSLSWPAVPACLEAAL